MNDFLRQIVQSKQSEMNLLKQHLLKVPNYVTQKLTTEARNKKFNLLSDELAKSDLTVIAEIKRASPSKGFIAPIDDPGKLASQYVLGGAKCISVLTEPNYFHGSADDLQAVKKAVGQDIPVLRKDFIIDPLQLVESLLMGANVLLLITGVLKKRLREFIEKSALMGFEAIVEVENEAELELAVESGAQIIGVNNRNLGTFNVSLDVAFSLIERIPHGIFAIAESGISHPSQARLFHQAGFSGVLIGEALVRDANPDRFIRSCLGIENAD